MNEKDLIGFKIVDIATTAVLGIKKLIIKKNGKEYALHNNKEGKLIIEDVRKR